MSEYITIDPVIIVSNELEPVGSIFGAIGSTLATAASKVGTFAKSAVFSKILEGGIAIGGGVIAAKSAAKSQKKNAKQLKADEEYARSQADKAEKAAIMAAKEKTASNRKLMIYGGGAVTCLAALYLITRKKH
jgi:hypothetical protein